MIQLAFLMGCNSTYSIGCDSNHTIPHDVAALNAVVECPDKRFVSRRDDFNHFDPDYFAAGRVWHKPNPELMIDHDRDVLEASRSRSVDVFNATLDGNLDVFPRVDLQTVVGAR